MGLRRVPAGGWPLDRLFVGVGTLRTTRELFWQSGEPHAEPLRAWDLSLWSQVTAQGSIDSVDRLERLGLITVVRPGRPRRAKEFVLEQGHPLAAPLRILFNAERLLVRRCVTNDSPRV